MNISTKGLIEIMSHEGICLDPYLDSVGVWTIGIGQTKSDDIDPRAVGKLTLQQAIDLFKRKIKQYTGAVDALKLDLSQTQYDALSSFCYNVGPGNLQKLCRNRSIAQIGEAIMLYTIPKEITERRQKEQTLFKTGRYSNTDGKVLVFPVANNKPQYSKGYQIDVRPYFSAAPVTPPPAKPVSTATKAGAGAGAVVVAGTVAATVQQGWGWPEIGLSAFIAAGLVTAVVLLYRKFKS